MMAHRNPLPSHDWTTNRAWLPLLWLLAGCDGCDPNAALPDAIECEVDSDCPDDGRYCNGVLTCEEATYMTSHGPWHVKQCQPSGPPCGGDPCDEEMDGCKCNPGDPDHDRDGADSWLCGGTDCDDMDERRTPGGVEICDADDLDEDCDPTTFGDRDADHDGTVDAVCCNGAVCGTDCDDQRADVHPTSVESCDRRDNDCDGAADEGVVVPSYEDSDGDGWGTGEVTDVCAGAPGWASLDGDCSDHHSQLHPGAFRCAKGPDIEVCEANGRWSDSTCPGLGLCVPQPDETGVCLPGDDFPQCSDGGDNDDDGMIDALDPECISPLDNSEARRSCANAGDDDDDGLLDYPDDPGCRSREDNDEVDPADPPVCSNGLDDDLDGTVDYALGTGDPGCVAAADESERELDGPECDNGLDDDGDKASDFPADLTCLSPLQDAELAACGNGLDDDLDGLVDFGVAGTNDPGCSTLGDLSERNPNGNACDNGLDDDGDGAADFPGDTDCADAKDPSE